MQPNYCLPIIKSHKTEVLNTIDSNQDNYSYFEVWLDYIDDLDEAFTRHLVELLKDRLILLFRRQNLENIKMALEQRFAILDMLKNTQVIIDLDVSVQAAELDHIKKNGLSIKTITSYHNYLETPDTMQLNAIIDIMDRYRPSIYKLATLCNKHADTLNLLAQLLELKSKDRRVIVVGMGELGVATRIFGTLWGNEMTFVPLSVAEQSAPGQLTRSQLESILTELKS